MAAAGGLLVVQKGSLVTGWPKLAIELHPFCNTIAMPIVASACRSSQQALHAWNADVQLVQAHIL